MARRGFPQLPPEFTPSAATVPARFHGREPKDESYGNRLARCLGNRWLRLFGNRFYGPNLDVWTTEDFERQRSIHHTDKHLLQ